MASTSSEHDRGSEIVNDGAPVNPSEVIYYTERLKEYYERSDSDVMSTLSTGTKAKYLEQLKGQLQIGEDEPPTTAVVPFDPDPMGLKPSLQHLGKEDLMNLIISIGKKWEEGGKPTEIKLLIDAVSGTGC